MPVLAPVSASAGASFTTTNRCFTPRDPVYYSVSSNLSLDIYIHICLYIYEYEYTKGGWYYTKNGATLIYCTQ